MARLLNKADTGLHELLAGAAGLRLRKRGQEWEVCLTADASIGSPMTAPGVLPKAAVTAPGGSPSLTSVTVLMRSRELVVVDKEFGASTEAVIARLQAQEDLQVTPGVTYRIRSVSRLDVPTSGALVVPLSARAEAHLTEQFRSRDVVTKVSH